MNIDDDRSFKDIPNEEREKFIAHFVSGGFKVKYDEKLSRIIVSW